MREENRDVVAELKALRLHGMAGAFLPLLDHDLDGLIPLPRGLGHRLGAMARHDHRAFGRKPRARHHRMGQKRRARDAVQDLGQVGIHPRPLSRGKNDKRCGHVAAFFYLRPVLTKAPVAARGWVSLFLSAGYTGKDPCGL